MEVILREPVEHLGRRGDVVKVSAGYARNYLLPRKLALEVNQGNRRRIQHEKQLADAHEAQEKAAAEALAARIAEVECVIARKAGETDTLYGSVTAADVADSLARHHQIEIDRRKVQLHEPIRQLGEFVVPARVHREVTAEIRVRVVKDEAPAKDAPPA